MQVQLEDVDFSLVDCTTRIPFRFGVATMTWAPLLTARVVVRSEAGPRTGCSSDLLVPRWFDKDPRQGVREDVQGLLASARDAAEVMRAAPPSTVFDLWWRAYRERVECRPPDASDRLVRGFGVALLERAVMDAACRAAGRTFFEALKEDLFAFRPGAVHAGLADWDLAADLPDAPLSSVELRHTVGLADPLRVDDVAPADRVDDGLPQALEEDVRRFGLRCFKVKIGGDRAEDLARLTGVARVLDELVPGTARLTLDGNEQFASLADLVELLAELRRRPEGERLLAGLLHVEQPLARAHTFDPERNAAMSALTELAPVIIDEADYGLDAFPRAMALGYRGVSIKNCKGVFRALLNRGLCAVTPPPDGHAWFQSGEDLTNLPVVALQQDLATMAALGIGHVERNGHHYFRGLAHLPAAEAREALERHPDLYEESSGGIALRPRDGRLALGSLQRPGYGYDVTVRTGERTPLADWRYPEARA